MPDETLIYRLLNEADMCRHDGANDIAQLLDEGVRALEYYQAIAKHRAPQWVPARVHLPDAVRGSSILGPDFVADAGEHDCQASQWGAVTVAVHNGNSLGVRPCEFEVVSWVPNPVWKKGGAA
jgi:hypothetical protein